MKRRAMFSVVLITALLFICDHVWAEGQTNPRRSHVEETIKWREKETGIKPSTEKVPGLFLAGNPTLTVTCNRVPTLAATGKFTVTVNNSDGSDWRYEYGICDYGRDPNGYIYYGNQTASRTFEDFTFYTAGEYKLFVFLFRADKPKVRVASASYSFSVAAKSGYPTLEEKAQAIVNECKVSGNNWQTALNLHNWLTQHVYYDQNYEYYGADVLFRGKGVCDSYSKAFKLLCETAGITAERVTSNVQNHAWNVIKFGSTWYQVDVTWDDPSGGTSAVSGNEHFAYFCLSDSVMFLDHKHIDVSYDPGCPSMEMNYYIRKNTWQTYGKYNSSGATIMGDLLDLIDRGFAAFELYLNKWEIYYQGTTGYGMMAPHYGIYVYGMEQAAWELTNGGSLKVEIGLHYVENKKNESFVSVRVTGWNISETGTLALPASVTTIDANAFEGIKSTTVIIPDGCTKISPGAFRNSGVRRMYVPTTVTTVADNAFDGCGRIIFILDETESEFAEMARQNGHLVVEP